MRKLARQRVILVSVLAIALLTSAIGTFAVAHRGSAAAASHVTVLAKPGAHVKVSNVHDVNVGHLPQEHAGLPEHLQQVPRPIRLSSTCPPSGCFPPEPAVAAAPTGLALEVVNTSLDLYNNNGVEQAGWPKNLTTFLGVPNPTPSGCAPNGPFLSNPRAWLDAYDNRFAVAAEQIEGGLGFDTTCNFQTIYWIAVSNTNNPSGTWRVFSINMAIGSDPTGVADFTQFGFDADGIYVSANIWNRAGTSFEYAEVVGCGKQAIYAGGAIVCNSWFGLNAGGVLVDKVNPVESLSTDFSPHAEYFVNTFDFNGDNNGHACKSAACSGIVVWSWSDPANTTGSGNEFIGHLISTSRTYLQPPGADQPRCTGGGDCLFSDNLGINSTPVYHSGHIFAAQETGVINTSGQFVTGIQWFDLVPSLTTGYPAEITGLAEYQDGLLAGKNSLISTIDPVVMPDLDNDLILGFVYTGDTVYPSINYTFRRVSDPLSTLPGGLGITAVKGTASSTDVFWGVYSSMSYPAPYQDFIWMASAYAPTGNDWATELIKLRFNLNG